MDKSSYLDAIGITRWVRAGKAVSSHIVLVDKMDSELAVNPLITAVLASAACQLPQCTFSDTLPSNAHVFWDMRRLKLPRVDARLSSPPVNQLATNTDAKRKLWGEISSYLDSLTSDSNDKA
ncbi:DNA polymerase III subunit psi [Shewanella sp. UCD-KL12]|uniref:DNA polymerase III subunit psi n=1 Tax=Shewanella sp. UCD-KL12 TaxID=1917163 RepID=UPI000970A91E|nr:DNA polymerase III subunit psi [Shewanella sp. UCD-KL12]